MEIVYKWKDNWEIKEETNLIITDNWYFEEATPIITIQATCDGLYDVYDELGDRRVGTYGVDTATIGIFKEEDCERKDILAKEYLYTKIPNFKGVITLCYNDDDMFIEYLLEFDGVSNGERIDWYTIFN